MRSSNPARWIPHRMLHFAAFCLLSLIVLIPTVTAAEIPASAQPLDGWTVPGTNARSAGNLLYITFSQPPSENAVLHLPRLVSVVRAVRWLEGSSAELAVLPEPREWQIRITGLPTSATPVLVLTLDQPPQLFQPLRPVPALHGSLLLRACEAEVLGKNLRYEPQPHKNTVGYWSVATDFAQWHCEIPADDSFQVDILQGCGSGHGGSQVQISLQEHQLAFSVTETGHFQNFIWKPLGQIPLRKATNATVTLRCLKKQAGAVMDVRAIRFTPASKPRSMQAELAAPDLLPDSLRTPARD